MGKIYAKTALDLENPRVAILSNGEEEGKGNELVREASDLISTLPLNFIGNIEPKEMLDGGADVIVSDGFVGNIMLKSLEASTRAMGKLIREEIMSDWISKIGGLLAQSAFRRVYKQVDPFEIGGAPLLGVNGVVIIGHGRSNEIAIKNALGQARKAVAGGVIEAMSAGLKEQAQVERR
jgi:glycerol-3-phosphate acyltransferase PlsX